MTAPYIGSAAREILRACWRARGAVVFPASLRAVGDELEALRFVRVLDDMPPGYFGVSPTQRGLDVGKSLCDGYWAMLWTELADKLASEASIALARQGSAAAVRIGARARRARHRARVAFLRAYGHIEGVAATLARESRQ